MIDWTEWKGMGEMNNNINNNKKKVMDKTAAELGVKNQVNLN